VSSKRYCWTKESQTKLYASAPKLSSKTKQIKLRYAARLQFNNETNKCTNNIVEYEAILIGLQKLRAISIQRCILHIDSKVVVGEIEKECSAREPTSKNTWLWLEEWKNFSKASL
jgi:ribonuclease HI